MFLKDLEICCALDTLLYAHTKPAISLTVLDHQAAGNAYAQKSSTWVSSYGQEL